MDCHECMRFLAAQPGVRDESLPAAVRQHMDGCAGCRGRHAALRLLEEGTGLHVDPPSGLADTLAARYSRAPGMRQRRRLAARAVPVAVAAALALAVILPMVGRWDGGRSVRGDIVRVHLVLDAPSAREVDVVGDWNDWVPKAQPMTRRDGTWEIVLELQRGRCYEYQFLIDGDRWVPDPRGLAKVDDGFGGMNSLLGT
jgi:hypothetical protein